MNIKKITCKDVMIHICENLGEELESQKCVEIKKHLSECSDCQHYFSSVEKTIEFYKKYDTEVSDDCHQRLMEKLGLGDE